MKKIICITGLILALSYTFTLAQKTSKETTRTTNFPEMRPITNSNIPGAPILSIPQRIDGTDQEIRTEKHGLIYPAFFDWNKDGKKDLLLGEFETGEKGSFIKVYLNEGTDAAPKFSGKYFYATDINGDTITNHQWCCIGIHPRIVDVDQDGYPDIVSGQYNPGLISWWRGSKDGFHPRVFIEQEGYTEGSRYNQGEGDDPTSFSYWNYTSVDFADFDGDGLIDMFVGGSGGLRVALNIGTKEKPKFGIRRYLLHTDGTKLAINGENKNLFKTYMTPVDWDGDGVLDLLLTYEYTRENHHPIEFFKGIQTSEGLRFERSIPLFTAKDGHKILPGCQPMITIVDYNNDGIKDIVFGISIPTVNGYEVAPEIAWEWIRNMGIEMPGKDAGRGIEYLGSIDSMIAHIEKQPALKGYYLGKLNDYKYLTLRHRGYAFVMYGTKNTQEAKNRSTMHPNHETHTGNIPEQQQENEKPVTYNLKLPERIVPDQEFEVELTISFGQGWHGYADEKINTALGFIPTTVEFEFPKGVEKKGGIILPEYSYSGPYPVYEGKSVKFKQKFTCTPQALKKELLVKALIQYQVCNENMCMPPEEQTTQGIINIHPNK